MKSLSRDRKQRYPSATELAADVNRFLSADPVLAAPPSRFYRFKTYFRKHQRVATAASIVALLLFASAVACFTLAMNAYRANGKLNTTVQLLAENVSRLEIAEGKIHDAAEEQLYESAISLALVKFDMEFHSVISELASQLFPDYFEEQPVVDISEEQEDQDYFELCFDYDSLALIDLPGNELLQKPLDRIRTLISENEKFAEQIFGEFPDSNTTIDEAKVQSESNAKQQLILESFDEHDHYPQCLQLQAEASKAIAKERHKFYRHLVREYRKTFGAKDPRVAESLNLLSASLMEIESFDEAEARLRESLAIANESDAEVAAKLLQKLESANSRRHRAASKRKR